MNKRRCLRHLRGHNTHTQHEHAPNVSSPRLAVVLSILFVCALCCVLLSSCVHIMNSEPYILLYDAAPLY